MLDKAPFCCLSQTRNAFFNYFLLHGIPINLQWLWRWNFGMCYVSSPHGTTCWTFLFRITKKQKRCKNAVLLLTTWGTDALARLSSFYAPLLWDTRRRPIMSMPIETPACLDNIFNNHIRNHAHSCHGPFSHFYQFFYVWWGEADCLRFNKMYRYSDIQAFQPRTAFQT